MPKTALITGISGQDGSYLSELLLSKGYEVHGVTRSRSGKLGCSEHLVEKVRVHRLERSDRSRDPSKSWAQTKPNIQSKSATTAAQWSSLIGELQPNELYHLAADSFVPNGWERPLENLSVNAGMTIEILEAIRNTSPATRMMNACSREIFGNWLDGHANEETEMRPTTPYGVNKAASRWMVQAYCERYDLFATNAILFNHESPRRREEFVTRKITKRVAEIRVGLAEDLELGYMSAKRDWGYAADYVDAMWRILQIDEPEDFVIGTGVTHSIEQFARAAFGCVDLNWETHVVAHPELARSNDGSVLAADITKAQSLLDWRPSVDFQQLVQLMIDADLKLAKQSLSDRDADIRRAA